MNSMHERILQNLKSILNPKKQQQEESISSNNNDLERGRQLFDENKEEPEQKHNKQFKQEEDDHQSNEISMQEDNHSRQKQSSQNQEQLSNIQSKIKSILKKSIVQGDNTSKKKVMFEIKSDEKINIRGLRKWNQKIKNAKKGKFEVEEERALMKSLNTTLNELNLNFEEVVQSLSEEEDKLPKNLYLWTKICSVLEDRTLISSYKFLKRLLCVKNKSGPWSEEETEHLFSLLQKYGRKWAKISKQMNRTAENVRDKYRQLGEENNEVIQKQFWSFQELTKFLQLLQKYSKVNFLHQQIQQEKIKAEQHNQIQRAELWKRKYNSKSFTFHNNLTVGKYMKDNFRSIKMDNINWKKISDKIGTKTIFDCRNKFVQFLQIQLKENQFTKQQIEKQIVNFVSSQKVRNQSQIEWRKWKDHCDIPNEQAKNRWMIFKRHIQGRCRKELKQLLRIMKEKIEKS